MKISVKIDTAAWTMLAAQADGKKLVGECSKCGKCCIEARPECAAENLVAETWDGVPVVRCKRHGPNKPVSCVIFPLPDSELPEGCTFRYEDA